MEIDKFLKYQDAAMEEIGDITRRVERGDLSIADGEAKIIPIFQGLERARAAVASAGEKKRLANFAGAQKAAVFAGSMLMLWVVGALVESYLRGQPVFHTSRMEINGAWAVLFMAGFGVGGAALAGVGLSRLRKMKNEPPNYSLKRTNQSLRD